jgi:hypothetical protein
MNVLTGIASNELFGGPVPEAVRALIDSAKQAPRETVSGILWAAQGIDPSALPVYYLLYKFHAGRGELAQAERAARAGLREAGAQAGLPGAPEDALSGVAVRDDFAQPTAARFWLFTLKALAFIFVRNGNVAAARRLIDTVARLDPGHGAGGEVTAALIAAAERA